MAQATIHQIQITLTGLDYGAQGRLNCSLEYNIGSNGYLGGID
jgi:hypothetical protein